MICSPSLPELMWNSWSSCLCFQSEGLQALACLAWIVCFLLILQSNLALAPRPSQYDKPNTCGVLFCFGLNLPLFLLGLPALCYILNVCWFSPTLWSVWYMYTYANVGGRYMCMLSNAYVNMKWAWVGALCVWYKVRPIYGMTGM